MRDVLVVGAGPAGSSAARYAARAGLDVLAVDKRQEIGAPKRCGEGVVLEALERDGIPLDHRWVAQEVWGLSFVGPGGRAVTMREDRPVGAVVERKLFDKHLASLAVREGARVRAWTSVESVERRGDRMRVLLSSAGRRWEEEARVVVCCEGEEGSVARSLGLAGHVPPGDLSSGAQYELVGVEIEDPTVLTCWVGRRVAPGGYAWLFPKGDDRANVGVTVLGAGPGAAFAHLDRFIAARPGLAKGSVLEVNAGTIPVGGPIRRLVADGVMVAGDSARQTNPIHAGGICEALEAGRFAGETAAAAIAAGDWSAKGLASYEERWARGYGRVQARLVRARRAIHALSDPDLDYLVSAVSPRDVVELLSGKGFARAVRIFAGRPSLARAFMA